jgi:hypothetical protein
MRVGEEAAIGLETVPNLGWSCGSPKRTPGPALSDDMVSVERTVHDGGSHLQHQSLSASNRLSQELTMVVG